MGRSRIWSDEDLDEAIAMLRNDATRSDLEDYFGSAWSAIRSALYRYRPEEWAALRVYSIWTDAQLDEALVLLNAGATTHEVAARYGRKARSLQDVLKRRRPEQWARVKMSPADAARRSWAVRRGAA